MKIVLTVFVFITQFLFADVISLNSKIDSIELPNQFDEKISLNTNTKKLIFSFSKDAGIAMQEFLDDKPKDYLSSKGIHYIVDVSKMPSFVKWFVLPMYKSNPYEVLFLSSNEEATKFYNLKKENMLSIVEIDAGVVKNIQYADIKENIAKVIE